MIDTVALVCLDISSRTESVKVPVIPGSNPGTIKTFSYEFYTTPDGTELCESCGDNSGYTDEELHPIFADTEVSSTPVCDVCGTTTDICTVLEDE